MMKADAANGVLVCLYALVWREQHATRACFCVLNTAFCRLASDSDQSDVFSNAYVGCPKGSVHFEMQQRTATKRSKTSRLIAPMHSKVVGCSFLFIFFCVFNDFFFTLFKYKQMYILKVAQNLFKKMANRSVNRRNNLQSFALIFMFTVCYFIPLLCSLSLHSCSCLYTCQFSYPLLNHQVMSDHLTLAVSVHLQTDEGMIKMVIRTLAVLQLRISCRQWLQRLLA